MKIIPMPEGTGALIARMAADDRKAASAEASPEPQAPSARCSVAVGSALRWAVFPCGWKWEIGRMTRENETPVAIFEHKHHAESFCREWWPQLGEVRSWPNNPVRDAASPRSL